MILIFSFVMIVTIIMIRLFVATLFQHSFERYVDDSNKVELYHLMNFDARGLYRNDEWDMDFIKNLGIDAIQKELRLKYMIIRARSFGVCFLMRRCYPITR